MRSKSMLALCLLLTGRQKQTSDDPIVASYKDTQIHESLVAYEKQNQINVTGDKTVSDADALDQILLNLIMLDEAEQQVVKLMKGADGVPVELEFSHADEGE